MGITIDYIIYLILIPINKFATKFFCTSNFCLNSQLLFIFIIFSRYFALQPKTNCQYHWQGIKSVLYFLPSVAVVRNSRKTEFLSNSLFFNMSDTYSLMLDLEVAKSSASCFWLSHTFPSWA